MKPGLYTKRLKAERVLCTLCCNQCLIAPGARGLCKVRENKKGKLYSLNYLKFRNEIIENIEKVGAYHFLPGTKTYILSSVGDNLNISEEDEVSGELKKLKKITCEQAVKRAIRHKCDSITFDGEESTMFIEGLLEIAKAAKSNKLKTLVITNGYMHEKTLSDIIKTCHGIIFALPTLDKRAYKQLTKAKAYIVQKNIQLSAKNGIVVEIVSKLLPDYNEGDLRKLAKFVSQTDTDIAWHVKNLKEEDQQKFEEIIHEFKLNNVYYEQQPVTLCPKCNSVVIDRENQETNLTRGNCKNCKTKIYGIF